MKKLLAACILGLVCFPGALLAAPIIPEETVWITPGEGSKAGDSVVLSALVYNSTQKNVTVTVGFFDGLIEVASTTSMVSAQSALALTAQWTYPENGKKIVAKVTKAVDGNKRSISELLGEVGSITVGTIPPSSSTTSSLLKTAKEMFGTVFSVVEPWRKKQAEHFTTLRDEKKALLGIGSAKEAIDVLNPIPPQAPAVPGTDTSTKETGLEDIAPRYQGIDIGGYIVFLYATAFATIFASVTLFYIVAILLALFVLKLIIRIVA